VIRKRLLLNVEDARAAARRKLPRPVFEFIDNGGEDEQTMAANVQGFSELRLLPRILVDVRERDLSTTVAGVPLACPVVFSPAGLAGMFHPDGELAPAVVAAAHGTLAVLSGHSTYVVEEVVAAAGVAPWFNLFPWRDQGFMREMLDRILAAGITGIVLTVDTPAAGNRERDRRNGFTAPPRFTADNLVEYARHPAWVANVVRHRRVMLKHFVAERPTLRSMIGAASQSAAVSINALNQAFSWRDLEWLRDSWDGVLGVKGAFRVEDAVRLADTGVEVLFVGNHGGRQLDGLQSGLEQMPLLAAAVGDRVDLVLDGGVRRGTDVVKAICLGARACSIGRPWVFGLAAAGTPGVERVLENFRHEIDLTLTLLGARSLAVLDSTWIARAGLPELRAVPSTVRVGNPEGEAQ
jgi:isopentenyl diphosphate isomerase/L-lactate dehydrogenase-like FMN-dependent dehydrogenase